VGQEVQVKVISIDHERRRIGLSIRQLLEDPWTQRVKHLREGQLVEGTITHLTKFGAFARLDEDLEGLIHISELSEHRINHPKEVVKEGDVVTLRVIKLDPERRRIGLSRRKVDSPAYSDLDWKMELAEEVQEVEGGAPSEEAEPEAAVEMAEEAPVEPASEAAPETTAEMAEEVMAEAPLPEEAEPEPPADASEEGPEAPEDSEPDAPADSVAEESDQAPE